MWLTATIKKKFARASSAKRLSTYGAQEHLLERKKTKTKIKVEYKRQQGQQRTTKRGQLSKPAKLE